MNKLKEKVKREVRRVGDQAQQLLDVQIKLGTLEIPASVVVPAVLFAPAVVAVPIVIATSVAEISKKM